MAEFPADLVPYTMALGSGGGEGCGGVTSAGIQRMGKFKKKVKGIWEKVIGVSNRVSLVMERSKR